MRLDPKHPRSLCLQASVHEARHEIPRAKDCYHKALALDPHEWQTSLSYALFQVGAACLGTRAAAQESARAYRLHSLILLHLVAAIVRSDERKRQELEPDEGGAVAGGRMLLLPPNFRCI